MKDEVLKLALEALEAGNWYVGQLEAIVYPADDLGTHEDRAKMQAAITAIKTFIDMNNLYPIKQTLAAPAPEVSWGVDWGRAGDKSCAMIIKRLPDGKIEVIAVEYEP